MLIPEGSGSFNRHARRTFFNDPVDVDWVIKRWDIHSSAVATYRRHIDSLFGADILSNIFLYEKDSPWLHCAHRYSLVVLVRKGNAIWLAYDWHVRAPYEQHISRRNRIVLARSEWPETVYSRPYLESDELLFGTHFVSMIVDRWNAVWREKNSNWTGCIFSTW